MRYALEPAAAYGGFLGLAGFEQISIIDSSQGYRDGAHSELKRMLGPLRRPMIDILGEEKQAHFVAQWQAMAKLLDIGALRTGRLRAYKPV